MQGEVRRIRVLRAASAAIGLAGIVLVGNGILAGFSTAGMVGAIAGGLLLIAAALHLRRRAEYRAAVANLRARQLVDGQGHGSVAGPGDALATALKAMAPQPAEERHTRRAKEQRMRKEVESWRRAEGVDAACALARMIDLDSLVSAKERERLLRLQAGGDIDALARLGVNDLVALATMAADPDRAAHHLQ